MIKSFAAVLLAVFVFACAPSEEAPTSTSSDLTLNSEIAGLTFELNDAWLRLDAGNRYEFFDGQETSVGKWKTAWILDVLTLTPDEGSPAPVIAKFRIEKDSCGPRALSIDALLMKAKDRNCK
jgi:hypothetical protein